MEEPEALLVRLDPAISTVQWEPFSSLLRSLHGVLHRCLEPKRKKRVAIEQLVPFFEDARSKALLCDEQAATCQSECVICLDKPKSHVLIPCGHRCCCDGCSTMLMSQQLQCPVCRVMCENALRVWD